DTRLATPDRSDAPAMQPRLDRPSTYAVATLHRPSNVDDPGRAAEIVEMLAAVAARVPLVLPLHPRGRPVLEAAGLAAVDPARLRVVEPLGYLEFMGLVRGAVLVLTDSGGIQEETTILGVPCLTLRPNTERPITISHGTNHLVEPGAGVPAVEQILAGGLVRDLELGIGGSSRQVGDRVVADDRCSGGPELPCERESRRVADVVRVGLECEPQQRDPRPVEARRQQGRDRSRELGLMRLVRGRDRAHDGRLEPPSRRLDGNRDRLLRQARAAEAGPRV